MYQDVRSLYYNWNYYLNKIENRNSVIFFFIFFMFLMISPLILFMSFILNIFFFFINFIYMFLFIGRKKIDISWLNIDLDFFPYTRSVFKLYFKIGPHCSSYIKAYSTWKFLYGHKGNIGYFVLILNYIFIIMTGFGYNNVKYSWLQAEIVYKSWKISKADNFFYCFYYNLIDGEINLYYKNDNIKNSSYLIIYREDDEVIFNPPRFEKRSEIKEGVKELESLLLNKNRKNTDDISVRAGNIDHSAYNFGCDNMQAVMTSKNPKNTIIQEGNLEYDSKVGMFSEGKKSSLVNNQLVSGENINEWTNRTKEISLGAGMNNKDQYKIIETEVNLNRLFNKNMGSSILKKDKTFVISEDENYYDSIFRKHIYDQLTVKDQNLVAKARELRDSMSADKKEEVHKRVVEMLEISKERQFKEFNLKNLDSFEKKNSENRNKLIKEVSSRDNKGFFGNMIGNLKSIFTPSAKAEKIVEDMKNLNLSNRSSSLENIKNNSLSRSKEERKTVKSNSSSSSSEETKSPNKDNFFDPFN